MLLLGGSACASNKRALLSLMLSCCALLVAYVCYTLLSATVLVGVCAACGAVLSHDVLSVSKVSERE